MLGINDIEVMTRNEVRPVIATGTQIHSLIESLPEETPAPAPEPTDLSTSLPTSVPQELAAAEPEFARELTPGPISDPGLAGPTVPVDFQTAISSAHDSAIPMSEPIPHRGNDELGTPMR